MHNFGIKADYKYDLKGKNQNEKMDRFVYTTILKIIYICRHELKLKGNCQAG